MIILKILSLFFWLLVSPCCTGLLSFPFLEKRHRSVGVAFIAGYILQFGLVELIGIPIVIYAVYNGFSIFAYLLAPVLVLMGVTGFGLFLRGKRKEGQRTGFHAGRELERIFKETSLESKILWGLFAALVLFQMYMAFTRASFDGDDAYYGVQALIAQQVDTLYRVNPYTGRSAPLDVRHALALFPIWEAFVGKVSGIHATIICHSVIPLVFIPLTYLIYFQIGKTLLAKKREMLPVFMLLLGLWQMFGNISLYTTETFFLTRTWQGKSFAGNFVIPAVVWIFLQLYGDEKRLIWWLLLGVLNLAGGASSSLAVLLSCLMTAGFGFLYAMDVVIRIGKGAAGFDRSSGIKESICILLKTGLSCVGGVAYVLVYLLLTHGFFGV